MGGAERVVYTWGDWWGSPEAIVRGERPEGMPHEVRRNEKVIKLVNQVAELQAVSKPVELGPPQAGVYDEATSRHITIRPLPLDPPWSVNLDLLAFAERYAKPEGWQRVILRGGDLLVLVGLRNGEKEPVALVAGGRWGS